MATWKDRHFLCKDKYVSWPGFSPRPYHRFVVEKPPHTDAKIQVCQKLRCPVQESARWHIWGYHTWLDVGRLPPLYRSRPDVAFDSNTWRWITAPKEDSMAEPPVPPPSFLDGNTYLKFIDGDALFVDQRSRKRAVAQTQRELRRCAQLKLRSECRAPPIDPKGNIRPPKGFKRFRHPLSGKIAQSLSVPLQPVSPSPKGFWNYPCPGVQPHYQEAADNFVLRNSSPLCCEVMEKYQLLSLSGSKIKPPTPVN